MFKQRLYKIGNSKFLWKVVMAATLYFTLGESFALDAGSKVPELNALDDNILKIATHGCHIAGCASALVGVAFAVAQQSLKVFGVAAAVTLLSFKAPVFFTNAMLI